MNLLLIALFLGSANALNSAYYWKCVDTYCEKTETTNSTPNDALSLPTCKLVCNEYAGIYPMPTGDSSFGNTLESIALNGIAVGGYVRNTAAGQLLTSAAHIFADQVKAQGPTENYSCIGKPLVINIAIADTSTISFALDTDESYTLVVNTSRTGLTVTAYITAENFFGARHGLQTLTQLIAFDDIRNEFRIVRDISIEDGPVYAYRGLTLDTVRNYIPVGVIKRQLTAMGVSKLNFLHWHLSDSQSFPFYLSSHPELSYYGAYSPRQVYTLSDVDGLIQFAKERGVTILPEFDLPAHVGEGWQHTGFVTCFKWQPWQDYCYEPPCGHLDPTADKLYDFVEAIYGELIDRFQPNIFHMGGDEVNFGCWNATDSIVEFMANQGWNRTLDGFMNMWNYFQTNASERLYKQAGREIPIILWSSFLTGAPYIEKFLPNDKYIIQVWFSGNSSQVDYFVKNDYRFILSQYDTMYLDCGFAAWSTSGNNYCSPYHVWQVIYENRPSDFAGNKTADLVLGLETSMWTETVDKGSIDSRIWPRTAAMAERAWSDPSTGWLKAVERFTNIRDQLTALGIDAEAIQPQWCSQNQANCNEGAYFNNIPNTST